MAPGGDVTSTFGTSGYVNRSGTSIAAPHVSGCIALMQQNSRLDQDDITLILKATSIDLEQPGPDNLTGWGRIDALKAVHAARIDCDLTGDGVVDSVDRDVLGSLFCHGFDV